MLDGCKVWSITEGIGCFFWLLEWIWESLSKGVTIVMYMFCLLWEMDVAGVGDLRVGRDYCFFCFSVGFGVLLFNRIFCYDGNVL